MFTVIVSDMYRHFGKTFSFRETCLTEQGSCTAGIERVTFYLRRVIACHAVRDKSGMCRCPDVIPQKCCEPVAVNRVIKGLPYFLKSERRCFKNGQTLVDKDTDIVGFKKSRFLKIKFFAIKIPEITGPVQNFVGVECVRSTQHIEPPV